jgi:hypothetical protein
MVETRIGVHGTGGGCALGLLLQGGREIKQLTAWTIRKCATHTAKVATSYAPDQPRRW